MFRYRQTPIHLQITAVSCKTRRAVLIHSNYRRILSSISHFFLFHFQRSSDLLCQIKKVETNFLENKNIHTIPINGQNARGSFSGS